MNAPRLLRLCCLFLGLASAVIAADLPDGWKLRESPRRSMLFALDFADNDHGWAVGLNAIVSTANAGLTWTSQWDRKGQAYWFNSIAALDGDRAVIAGHPYATNDQEVPGLLLRTTDGGKTWAELTCGSPSARYNSVVFRADGLVGYVITNKDGLMRTADGGDTWTQMNTGGQAPLCHMTLRQLISLPDEQTVMLPGQGELIVSQDDGSSWNRFPLPEEAHHPHRWLCSWATFATAKRGWIQIYGGDRLATTDGGLSWAIDKDPNDTLWVENENALWRTTAYEVSRSKDAGATWSDPVRIGGQWDRIGALTFTKDMVHLAGGDEGNGQPFLADRLLELGDHGTVTLPEGVVDINFTMPNDGIATVQILDQDGKIVKHLLNGVPLPKGAVDLKWDLSTIDDYWNPFRKTKDYLYTPPASAEPLARPGTYTWRALYHPPLSLEHRFSYYPLGVKGMPWLTADRSGGWLSDHEPPRCLVAADGLMWLGTFCEGGDCLIQSDLSMKKLWGENRMFLTNPQALASEGEYVWFIEAGGWGNGLRMVRVHRQTKRSELLFQGELKDGDPKDISGLAVVGERAVVAYHDGSELLVLDLGPNIRGENKDQHIAARIPAKLAGSIRPYRDGRLAVVVDHSVSLLDLTTKKMTPVVTGLSNPMGLAVDAEGRFYVGEMAPLHQVVVYDAKGVRQRVIGKRGPHPVGPFDRDNLENPRGVEIAADGKIWVTEWNQELKRTSIWDKNGKCVDQVLGPTVYGGGGEIDPADADRLFYRGKEFRRDAKTGEIRLVNIFWRRDDANIDEFAGERAHNFGGQAPSAPFHRNGKMFFRLWGGYGMGDINVLFVYDVDHVRPVSAVGLMPEWLQKRLGMSGERPAFAWTDRNEDGKAQGEEIQTGPIAGTCSWGTRMNENFEVSFSTNNGDLGFSFFRVASLTKHGYPVYTMPERFEMIPDYRTNDPCQIQGMMTDAKGNALSLGPYLMSVAPDGTVNWRYASRWPSLHAGYATTAAGVEPGVLIAPLRFHGSVQVPGLGEVISFGTNYGQAQLFTADGMYIGAAFGDSRRSDLWRFAASPSPQQLSITSLGQEHFGGSFQRARGADGKDHNLYVVSPGSPQCAVVELHGLEKVQRIQGSKFSVTDAHRAAAETMRRARMAAELAPKRYTVARQKTITIDGTDDEWQGEQIDGFRVGYDDTTLYLYFSGRDERAPFANAATADNFTQAFTKGDVIDLMLETEPGRANERGEVGRGDMRLSLTMLDGKPGAILYDAVVPGTSAAKAHDFSSPWRSVRIDAVVRLPDVRIEVRRQGDDIAVEAAIPLAAIHFKPSSGLKIRADVGRVMSDQTGTTRSDRRYWSNPDTLVVSDVPSEAALAPNLWGTFTFE